jgi:3-isopropylmalate/(R)-2-methylmalate dehydratase small subunit
VGGRNVGTGSSCSGDRSLRHLGMMSLVAESINYLFYRNCVNIALVPLQCLGVVTTFE